MSSQDRFWALMAAVFACIAVAGSGLRYLMLISLRTGQLVERLDGHVRESDETDADHENRLRSLEQDRRRR